MANPVNILLVDDQQANLLALEAVLQPLGQNLLMATSGEQALRLAQENDFAVILLDIQLGDLDGFTVAQRLRAQERSQHTPIIFLTAFESEEFSPAQAYTLGAVDYLLKPLVPEILLAKVDVFVKLYQRTEQVRQLQRHQSENEALRRFRAILERSFDALALIGADGVIRYTSPSTTRILGYSTEEFVGHNIFELMHPDDMERTQKLFAQLLAQPEVSLSAPFRFRHREGGFRWLEGSGTNLLADPAVGAIVGNFRDITERREAETVRAELAAIVESSEDAIIGEDLQGIITSWNKGAERLYGYTAAEIVGKPVSLLHPPELPDELPDILQRQRRGEHIEHFPTVRLRKDGSRVDVSLSVSPIRDSDGQVIGSSKISRDIGPQKRLEEELRQRAEELAEAHRQKDEFLVMLAHELRNPLAPLKTGVHILTHPQAPPEARAKTQAMMERQVNHLTRLVGDLLDVSSVLHDKIELRQQRLDLGMLAHTTAEDRRALLEKVKLQLQLEVPDKPVWVMGDATRLSQILTNLLDNCQKFADGGGRITVRVTADEAHKQAILFVRDEGMGIEPELLPHLFDAFKQADRSLDRRRGGLGLGLTLVKGLTELHGGSVKAYSAGPGQGAEFTVRLPLELEPTPLVETKQTLEPTKKHMRILVIEDQPDGAEMLRMLLCHLGHKVKVAHTGCKGVEVAQEWQPDFVLCDIGLPGMDGWGVARAIRSQPHLDRVRLLAVTGYGSDEDLQRSRDAGFDAHLVKPVDPVELQRLLTSA